MIAELFDVVSVYAVMSVCTGTAAEDWFSIVPLEASSTNCAVPILKWKLVLIQYYFVEIPFLLST